MNNKTINIAIMLCGLALLQGCSTLYQNNDTYAAIYPDDASYYNYNGYYTDSSNIDYGSYDTYADYPYYEPSPIPSVPQTYHTSQGRYATSHKSRDKSWVNQQKRNGYTIQLDSGTKAASVAKTLVNAPKSQRTAQIKTSRNGQNHYRGVYGSYATKAQAQAVYKQLPNALKQKANIKQWHQVQD